MKIKAKKRSVLGKKVKKLREKGLIPASVYGKELKSTTLSVEKKDFTKVYREAGHTSPIDLEIDREKITKVLIQEVQRDPLSNDYLHVSFYQIDLKKPITTSVPITLTNKDESKAVKEQGGVIIQPTSEIEIRCTPFNIPQEITIDTTNLSIGDSIRIKDVTLPTGVELIRPEDKELVVAVATVPTEEPEVEKPAEEGAAAVEEASEEIPGPTPQEKGKAMEPPEATTTDKQ